MIELMKNICERAITSYGEDFQMRKAVEEMAELTSALLHFKEGRATVEEVRSEIADVLVTATELSIIFGEEETLEAVRFKLARLARRLRMPKEYVEGVL